jgi:hypothetical protein
VPVSRLNWKVGFAVALVTISAALYYVHYLLFHNPEHIFIFLVSDIAFVPIEVLLVTLVLDGMLRRHDRLATVQKLNMVVGAFFTDVGTEALQRLSTFDRECDSLAQELRPTVDWKPADFAATRKIAEQSGEGIDARLGDLPGLFEYLHGQRDFLLRLLENPNLLEHDQFTDMLWAVTHLLEELARREDLSRLSEKDLDHLSGDLARAYGALAGQWIGYMSHLQKQYPYLFSLAVRTNPLDPNARAEVG